MWFLGRTGQEGEEGVALYVREEQECMDPCALV